MAPGLVAMRAVAVVVLAALTGCSFGNGPEFLRRYERPGPGQAVPESFWMDASARPAPAHDGAANDPAPREVPVAFEASFWLLPTWFSGRHMEVSADDERVTDTEFRFLDLGVALFPFLPLWFSMDSQLDSRSGGRAECSTTWTPLWTSSRSTGWPAERSRAVASGFPLLYGRIEYGRQGEEPSLEMHNLLWTLGPCWMRGDPPEEGPDVARVHVGPSMRMDTSGWAFCPLLLAGPGAWLWTSTEFRDRRAETSAHGPLGGWLGYRASLEHDPPGAYWTPPSAVPTESGITVFTRRVLGGVLWYDSETTVYDVTTQARHGPLWGLFGWGRSGAEPVLYLLWFPIER